MKKVFIAFGMVLCLILVVSCGKKTEVAATSVSDFKPESVTEKYWYAMGSDLMAYYSDYYGYYAQDFDFTAFAKGIQDYADGSFLYSDEEVQAIAAEYYEETEKVESEKAAKNLVAAESFLAENAKKDGIVTTESGLQYKIITKGAGECPEETDTVTLNYSLSLMDGTVVETTFGTASPASFPLSGVITGFSEGVQLMPVGSTYEFYIHPDLGYGAQSSGSLEANSLLIFKIELLSIDK